MNRRVPVLLALLAVGCGGTPSSSNEVPIDPALAPDLSRIRISAVDDSDRFAIVGLSGTLPENADFEVIDDSTGDPVAAGAVGGDGSFAVWATSLFGRPVLRAVWQDGHARGPDAPLDVPDSASLRAVAAGLVAAESLPDHAAHLRGLVGAAPGSETLIVGGLDTVQGKAKGTAVDGAFDLDFPGNPNDKVLLFVTSAKNPAKASIALQVIVTPGAVPMLVSARRDSAGPVALLGVPGVLAPGSPLHVTTGEGAIVVESTATVDGAFGACGDGLSAGDLLSLAGKAPDGADRAVSRLVPAAGTLPAVLNPALSAQILGEGTVDFLGTVDPTLGVVVAVSCSSGRSGTGAVASTGDLVLSVPAKAGELLAVVGIGRTGEVGQAELVIAGSSEALSLPLPAPLAGSIKVSVALRGAVVVAGVAGAALPGARVEAAVGSDLRVWPAQQSGEFSGLAAGVSAGTTVTLTQIVGPYRSAPLVLTVPDYVAGQSPLPVVDGLVSAAKGSGGFRLHLYPDAAPPGDVVLADLTRSTAMRVGGDIDFDIGGEGDLLAVFPVSDAASGTYAIRTAQGYDPPALVSSAGAFGCVVGPPATQEPTSAALVIGEASEDLTVVHGASGAWFGTFPAPAAGVEATVRMVGADAQSERLVPPPNALSAGGFSVHAVEGHLVVADGGLPVGPEWVVVVARADGDAAVVRPPTAPPWSVKTALAPSADLYVFAVDASTGTATACIKRAPDVAEQGPPAIDEVLPAPLVLSKPYTITGSELQNGTVTIAAVPQVVTATESESIDGVVAEGTPLGPQTLRVTTSGGYAEAQVTVVAGPVIQTVVPTPLIVGKTATVGGLRFGEAPDVTLGGLPMSLATTSDTLVTFTVPPTTPTGDVLLALDSGVGTDSAEVGVVCIAPIIDSATPNPAFYGGQLALVGDHFLGAQVTIGGIEAAIVSGDDTQLTVIVSSQTPQGPVTVEVWTTCGSGLTEVVVASAPPVISDTSPKPAIVGALLDVTGDHLAGAAVTLGGVAQVLSLDTKTLLTFKVAAGTPLGAQTLVAKTYGGEASAPVTVVTPPIIDEVSPDPVIVGNELTILGQHLLGGTVTVGGAPAAVKTDGDGKLVVLVALEAQAGLGQVVVTTLGGSDAAEVTVLAPPKIVSLDPSVASLGKKLSVLGKSLGGASITIGGVAQAVTSADPSLVVLTVNDTTPLGFQTLVATTAGGTDSIQVKVVLTPLIVSVTPAPLSVAQAFTVTGKGFAPGATTVTIGGVTQSGATSTAVQIQGTVAAGTPLGERVLTVTTADGSDSAKVTVIEGPSIDTALPDPVEVGKSLTVTGKHLAAFTKTTLGGVVQNVFSVVTDTKLVFKVVAGTPLGSAQPLIITTPTGTATAVVGVIAAGPVGPIITDVQPGTVAPGDTIVVYGMGFDGATFTIGGLSAAPLAGGTDFTVTLVLPGDVPSGVQDVVASEATFPSSAYPILVLPPPPDAGLIYISSVSVKAEVGMAGLPGAFVPGATVYVNVGLDFVTTTALPDGSLSLLFKGVEAGESVTFVQAVGDATSGELVRTLELPTAIPAPHPYLLRVELVPGGVEVYGPPPSFGPGEHLVIAGSEGRMGFATAAELHADPTQGIVVTPAGTPGAQTFVFTSAAPEGPASPPLIAYAVPLDPPMLSSSLHAGFACSVGLAGSVVGELTLGLAGQGGSGLNVSKVTTTPGSGGTFLTLAEAAGSAAELVWSGTIGGEDFNTLQPNVDVAAIASQKVTLKKVSGGVSVTVTGSATGAMLVAATSDGAAAAAFGDAAGDATALVPGTGAMVYVFVVPLGLGNPTGCLSLPAP